MGNCFATKKSSPSEIAPYDLFLKSTSSSTSNTTATAAAAPPPTVHLHGSPSLLSTSYIRFALLYKPLSLNFVPTDSSPVLHIDSESVSGSTEELLRFIDSKFPYPQLVGGSREEWGRTTPWVVKAVVLQHRSVIWHLQRMVRWGEDLVKRGGRKTVDPKMGSPRMEVRKFGKSYSQLLEVMLEHAQMEERAVFPILEMADRGLCKVANEEHARDLPIMNGIKEDIKSIGVLDTGNSTYQEALSNLSARLKSLKERCKQHFEEEERNVLPLMEAVELTKEQQVKVLEQCFDAMQGTHAHLFNFFIEGLLPCDAIQYLDLIISIKDEESAASMLHRLTE